VLRRQRLGSKWHETGSPVQSTGSRPMPPGSPTRSARPGPPASTEACRRSATASCNGETGRAGAWRCPCRSRRWRRTGWRGRQESNLCIRDLCPAAFTAVVLCGRQIVHAPAGVRCGSVSKLTCGLEEEDGDLEKIVPRRPRRRVKVPIRLMDATQCQFARFAFDARDHQTISTPEADGPEGRLSSSSPNHAAGTHQNLGAMVSEPT
jgi:hypothetical protein